MLVCALVWSREKQYTWKENTSVKIESGPYFKYKSTKEQNNIFSLWSNSALINPRHT